MSTINKEDELVSTRGLRVSKLPADLRADVQQMNIDRDGDGKIDAADLGMIINNLLSTKKDNKFLRNSVAVLVVFALLLTGCVFGASIAAARLSKDTSVDSVSGILYAKGSDVPIKMEPVSIHKDGVNIFEMTTEELDALNEIVLDNGSIKFHVKGYVILLENNQVGLIVEGGLLIYGEEGLVSATGIAETVLNLAYSSDDDAVSLEGGSRQLAVDKKKINSNQNHIFSNNSNYSAWSGNRWFIEQGNF